MTISHSRNLHLVLHLAAPTIREGLAQVPLDPKIKIYIYIFSFFFQGCSLAQCESDAHSSARLLWLGTGAHLDTLNKFHSVNPVIHMKENN